MPAPFRSGDVVFPIRRILFLVCVAALLTGCVGGYALGRLDGPALAASDPVAWYGPAVPRDRATLARWRASVGPPILLISPSAAAPPSDEMTIVSWNTALGAGDVDAFVRQLRTRRPNGPLILLLQEVYRRGAQVPTTLARHALFARRLGRMPRGTLARDIESVAAALSMSAYYVPSMRNGGADSDEDRGNAIITSAPLSDLRAIELPFERQRRVAVAATVHGRTADGVAVRIRVVSAHLDNTSSRRVWLAGEYGRARQMRGLVALLSSDMPTVLGGDFNTWFGFSDQAFVEAARAFPQTPIDDRRSTFLGLLRLDHLFYRLPAGWDGDVTRGEERYGSDHAPLIGTIRFAPPR